MVVLFLHNGVMSISTANKFLYKGIKSYDELKNNLLKEEAFFSAKRPASGTLADNCHLTGKPGEGCGTSGISDIVIKKLNHYNHGR